MTHKISKMIWSQKNNDLFILYVMMCFFIAISNAESLESNVKILPKKANGLYELFPSDSNSGHYKNAAVATTSKHCAKAGVKILKKGGSAVDAAIATLLCEGVVSFYLTGLGGGFMMTIWDANKKKAYFLNSKEYAPSAAYNNSIYKTYKTDKGGASVAIPGEVAGFWEAHKKFGKLPWEDLFEDAIKLCENGFRVSKYAANTFKKMEKMCENVTFTSVKLLITAKDNKTLLDVGDIIKRPNLAKTLRLIQKYGKSGFYDGDVAKTLVNDIQKDNGLITLEEFKQYKPDWKEPLSTTINGKIYYTAPAPGSGALAIFMLNILENLINSATNKNVMWHRIVESFKWAYAKKAELGDYIERPEYANKQSKEDCKVNSKVAANLAASDNYDFVVENGIKFDKDCLISVTQKLLISKDYAKLVRSYIIDTQTFNDVSYYNATRKVKDDHGTSQTSVYAPDGSAVSVTASINFHGGSLMYSEETGVILNNLMDDYSYPEVGNPVLISSEFNLIRKGHLRLRPQSSMVPTIILNEDKTVRLVIGSAGGPKITTGSIMVTVLHLFLNQDIRSSIEHPRIHHQLSPMSIIVQSGFDREVIKYLQSVGHNISDWDFNNHLAAVAVTSSNNISAAGDYRREGAADGF